MSNSDQWNLQVGDYVTHRGVMLQVTDIMQAFGEDYTICTMVETDTRGIIVPVKELVAL